MKKILITLLLITLVLTACKSKDEPEEKKPDTPKVEVDEKEKEDEDEEVEEEIKTETEIKDKNEVIIEPEENTDDAEDSSSDEETAQTDQPVVPPANEKVEDSAEKIIWAQNDRDYTTLKAYLGQNITIDENKNILKIKNTPSPYDAEFLKEIEADSLEHRYTHKTEKDYIVGYAAFNKKQDMSYTIDLTMRMGSNGWKMINMQVNK